jgi:hypothetical protein
MCPACLAAAAFIAGSAITTSGVAALVVKKVWTEKLANGGVAKNQRKESHDGQ